MLPIKCILSCLCTYTLTSVFAPEHLSTEDIYAKTADSSGEHDGRTTPVDNTEEPANSVDIDPRETVTDEQPVDSPRETVTTEQAVGDSMYNEDTDEKSESHANDAEDADTTEERNEDGLDTEENDDDGIHDAEPVTYIPEDAEERGDEPDCGRHEEDKVTDVAVDQGRFGWTCVVLYTRWKPLPLMRVCLLLSACNPNLPA